MQSQTIDFLSPPAAVPSVLLPEANTIFLKRAERLSQLTSGHALAQWLDFIRHLTQAQHVAMLELGALPLPAAEFIEQSRAHGMPPLNATASIRPVLWQSVLRALATALLPHAPETAAARLKALCLQPAERLETMADALLRGDPEPALIADLPFIAAALQVVWTAWACRLDTALFTTLDTPEVCPCCGSLPVASIVRVSSAINNLRYLHCSLCNSEWNVPRATCTACKADKSVSYQQIEGSCGAVRAECCDECNSYLKIMVQEKDAAVDPVADDLATLALDILVDEAGYSRSGPNLLLLGGAG